MLKRLIISKQDDYTTAHIKRFKDDNTAIQSHYVPSLASCNRLQNLIAHNSEYREKHSLKSWEIVYIYPGVIELSFMFTSSQEAITRV